MLFQSLFLTLLVNYFPLSASSPRLPTRHLCLNLLTDLLQNPVSLVQIDSGKLYVAERDGKIQLVSIGDRSAFPEVALDLSDKVLSKGEQTSSNFHITIKLDRNAIAIESVHLCSISSLDSSCYRYLDGHDEPPDFNRAFRVSGDHLGILAMTLHPRFRSNGFIYVMYRCVKYN